MSICSLAHGRLGRQDTESKSRSIGSDIQQAFDNERTMSSDVSTFEFVGGRRLSAAPAIRFFTDLCLLDGINEHPLSVRPSREKHYGCAWIECPLSARMTARRRIPADSKIKDSVSHSPLYGNNPPREIASIG